MTSPLLPYANSYLLITSQGTPQVVDGRVTTEDATRYIVQCYLVRQQAAGTTTGADYIPTQTTPGEILPGSSGLVYLYRGYALRYAITTISNLENIPSTLAWNAITNQPWLTGGATCYHRQGNEQIKYCTIETATGKYGNTGIDSIINQKIAGIPITVRSGDLTG
jgi:hypothetical protein